MSENKMNYGSLGQGDSYAVYTDTFDPKLLNPMPRHIARDRWGITGGEFTGLDIWHCHEATFLLDNGMPIAGTLKFIYSSDSEFMVESKSMKLYLNSFDMCKMGKSLAEAKDNYKKQIKKDLEKIINATVRIEFFDSCEFDIIQKVNVLEDQENLMSYYYCKNFQKDFFDDYKAQINHIELTTDTQGTRLYTNVLRSRCRHTKQKDSGTASIIHHSNTVSITPLSFLRQVVSLREVDEFHEFSAEKLFVDIRSCLPKEDDLTIALLYSRRGSLDITPIRTTSLFSLNWGFTDVHTLCQKVQGQ